MQYITVIKIMKNYTLIYIYGAIIILEGIFLLFSRHYTFQTIKLTLGVSLIIAAVLAFLKVLSRQNKRIEFSYHEIHSLSMLIYGLAVLLFANSLETLVFISVFLFFFYTFSEISFCIWVFNLGKALAYKIVLVRVFLGLIVGLGAVVILHYFNLKEAMALEGFGALFIIIGINILLYVPIMKRKDLNESTNL